jgi:hypothetical protein
MPTFNVFTDLIEPLGEFLQSHPALQGISIYYDRTRERRPQVALLPAINYFWIGPTEDLARGSGSTSLQVRRKKITIGFGVWVASTNPVELDRALWEVVGTLEDLLRSKTNFNPNKGITLTDAPIANDVDYSGESPLVGSVLVTCQFEMFGGRFAGGPDL